MWDTDPSGSAVGSDTQGGLYQEDQDHGHHISQGGKPFPEGIRDIGNDHHEDQTDDIGDQLFLHIIGGISIGIISLIGAGRIDHDQSESQ